ncbi:MAG TPA: hypothetical protein VNT56_07410 [Acidimicrobiales bacterium]|nr:hypothetical protein [Acidimicrobiales bacterium]
MADIVDTSPAFEAFAKAAFIESPVVREQLWEQRYEGVHPEIFAAFYDGHGTTEGRPAVVRDLSTVRSRVRDAAPVERRLIEEVEPAVRQALGLEPEPAPQHVLLVGSFSTDADVGRLDDRVTLFHCLEWFHAEDGMRLLVAHEDTHAWHEIALGLAPPEDDAAWLAFYEGTAIAASRAVVPNQAPDDYFWYGHGGFADWLPWCEENRDALLDRFKTDLDSSDAVETWFGSGLVDNHWRVGYYLADQLVGRLDRPLPELVALSVDEAKAAIRSAF